MIFNSFQNSSTFSISQNVGYQQFFNRSWMQDTERQLEELNQILINQYWVWVSSANDDKFDKRNEKHMNHKRHSKSRQANTHLMLGRYHFDTKADRLLRLLSSVNSESNTLIYGNRKADPKNGPLSSTRSAFIGVSSNGQLWQALITVNKRKTYIGSYESERDAAIAFDFYSILLHSLRAKTNFNYSKKEIMCMIANFKENNNCFKPELLDIE